MRRAVRPRPAGRDCLMSCSRARGRPQNQFAFLDRGFQFWFWFWFPGVLIAGQWEITINSGEREESMLVVKRYGRAIGAVCQNRTGHRAPPCRCAAPPSASRNRGVEPGTLDGMPGAGTDPRQQTTNGERDVKQKHSHHFCGHGCRLAVLVCPSSPACAIENRGTSHGGGRKVCRAGAQFFRGGATSRVLALFLSGLGEAAQSWRNSRQIRNEDRHRGHRQRSLELVERYDVIGRRPNMQNYG